MLPNKLNHYLSLCLLVLVTLMTGGQASAIDLVGNEMMPVTQKMSHSSHDSSVHYSHDLSVKTSMNMHCANMGHYDHSGQCSQHSSHGGCGNNACSGGVIGALFSTTFVITDFSHPQHFYSLSSSEHQGYPSSLYRPPIA